MSWEDAHVAPFANTIKKGFLTQRTTPWTNPSQNLAIGLRAMLR